MTELIIPKLYLNGFPKSGLHLAERYAMGMLERVKHNEGWYGTNAWTTERHNLDLAAVVLGGMKPGEFRKGHMGYLQALEALFVGLEIGVVFIYRDLRDVAVSQAHHILMALDGSPDHKHPKPQVYAGLDFEDILIKVIEGTTEFPGIFGRWETFAPWLGSKWVLPVRFERMIETPSAFAHDLFNYLFELACPENADVYLKDNGVRAAAVSGMLFEAGQKHASPTYRKGKAGGWRAEFTPAVKKVYKRCDIAGWTVRLGYEENEDW